MNLIHSTAEHKDSSPWGTDGVRHIKKSRKVYSKGVAFETCYLCSSGRRARDYSTTALHQERNRGHCTASRTASPDTGLRDLQQFPPARSWWNKSASLHRGQGVLPPQGLCFQPPPHHLPRKHGSQRDVGKAELQA